MREKTTIKSVLSRILSKQEYKEYCQSRRRASITLAVLLPWLIGYTLLLGSLSLLSNILGFTSLVVSNIVILYFFAMNSRKCDRYDERAIGKPSKKEDKAFGIGFVFLVLSILSTGLLLMSQSLAIFSVLSLLTIALVFIIVNVKLFMDRKRKALRSWATKLG